MIHCQPDCPFYRVFSRLSLEKLDVFEQQASFGGVWNYTNDPDGTIDVPQTNPFQPLDKPAWLPVPSPNPRTKGNDRRETNAAFVSPMYRDLETNIPHVLMKHSDADSLETHQLFPTRQTVIGYLSKYAKSIRNLVLFQTQVCDIRRTQDILGAWLVRYRDLQSQRTYEAVYDAVLVASGHYTVPTIPDIKGIAHWHEINQGVISHSKYYRRPDSYTNKKVIVVGNSASGVDIASQIASVSKHPLLNATRSNSPLSYTADYKTNVPEIEEFLPPSQGTRAVRFTNGRIEDRIDAVLFCTGYYYSFPFLSSICPKLISTGDRVQYLYKHMFYIPDPTLAFIGLPSKVIPFRTFEIQAAIIGCIWLHHLELPTQGTMTEWEEALIAERGVGKSFHVLPFPQDIQYHNDLVEWALSAKERVCIEIPPKWSAKETWLRERFPAIKKAFADRGEDRCRVRTVEDLGFDYENRLQDQIDEHY